MPSNADLNGLGYQFPYHDSAGVGVDVYVIGMSSILYISRPPDNLSSTSLDTGIYTAHVRGTYAC